MKVFLIDGLFRLIFLLRNSPFEVFASEKCCEEKSRDISKDTYNRQYTDKNHEYGI